MTHPLISRAAVLFVTLWTTTAALPRTIELNVLPFCFDDLKTGTAFGPGDTFDVEDGKARVRALSHGRGEEPATGQVTVEQFVGSTRTKAGKFVSMKNAILEIGLTDPMAVAELFYRDPGQVLHLEVNGEGKSLGELDRMPESLGGAQVEISILESGFVRVRLTGTIESFAIGGDRLDFDCGYRRAIDIPLVFARGDVDDSGSMDLGDAVRILSVLFQGGEIRCEDAADTNDDGGLNVTDPIYLLDHLFRGGPAPPTPAAEPGEDPTEDSLACRPLFQRG
jgi:hypothetical protein